MEKPGSRPRTIRYGSFTIVTNYNSQSIENVCFKRNYYSARSGGEKGAKSGMCPGRHCAGEAFGWSKILNAEIWPLLTIWRLHCRQRYFIFIIV